MSKPSHLSLVRSAEPSDPIFTAIERHRRSWAEWSAAVEREFNLEEEGGQLYAEAAAATEQKAMTKYGRCWDLVGIRPTTTAGAIALLRYFADSEPLDNGTYWPNLLNDEEVDYGAIMARHVADALEQIARSEV